MQACTGKRSMRSAEALAAAAYHACGPRMHLPTPMHTPPNQPPCQPMQLEKRIEHNVSVARELVVANKKDRALLALKKKKLNEHQLQMITAWVLNVEDVVR